MTLSEQTNATILNTLNGVRHNPFLPSLFPPGSHPLVHLFAFWLACFAVLAPLVHSVGPFLLRYGPISGSSFPVCPILIVVLFTWVLCLATGAFVHRRGRCIGVSFPLVNGTSLVLVLVCLSVDVTGALTLPNSFCFDCLLLLHAPPPFCPFVTSPYFGLALGASLLPCRCCPPFFFRPTPPRLSPGRYTSFYLPEIELICMQSHKRELVWTST